MNAQPLNRPLSVLMPPSAPRRRATRHRPRRALVLSEELFRDVLRNERKRADRSSQSAVLLLVAVNDGLGANSPSTWAAVTEVLTEVARETDVLGWFEWRAVLGVIMPEVRSFGTADAHALEARICQEIARRSDGERDGRFSVRIHVHPEPKRTEEEGQLPIGAFNFPEVQGRQERARIDGAIKR